MSRGKTEFTFTFNTDPAAVNRVIQNYLAANDFKPVPKAGANYYYFNDPFMKGKRSLEYYIQNNKVTILAYLGKYEKPKALEGAVAAIPKQSFKNDLAPLFEEIKRLESGYNNNMNDMNAQMGNLYNGNSVMQGENPYNGNPDMQQNQSYNNGMPQFDPSLNTFTQQANSKKETWTVIGFVMSIFGVILSLFGITYGVVLLMLEFYFGAQGLHTRRKPLAIATFALACLSILILIINVVLVLSY